MPPKPRSKDESQSGDSETEAAIRKEMTEFIGKLRHTTNEGRRKKREELEAGYALELKQVSTAKMKALREQAHAKAIRREKLLHQLSKLITEKREFEQKIEAVLEEVETRTVDALAMVKSGIEASRGETETV